MSLIPSYARPIPDLPPIPGEWIAWQIMGDRGPGRWTSRHYTADGRRTACGKKIPPPHEMFRRDAIVQNVCPACKRKAGQ